MVADDTEVIPPKLSARGQPLCSGTLKEFRRRWAWPRVPRSKPVPGSATEASPFAHSSPGAVAEGEWFALGYFDDARFGLEAYAEAVGKIYDVQLLPQTSSLCTWYMDCQARYLRLETKDVSPRPLLLQRITILGQ
jgi:hypothetical protein